MESTPQQIDDGRDGPAFTLRWTFERADLEDVFRASLGFLRRIRRWMMPPALILVVLSVALQPSWSEVGELAPRLFLVLLVAIMPRWMPSFMTWLGWRASRRLQGGEMEATVSAAGVRVQSPGAVTECTWDVFERVHETDRAFLLPYAKSVTSSLVLPKRAVTGQADIAALRGLLHRMIDGGAPVRS